MEDKAQVTDNAFIRELFMQRLQANVRMVLVSTPDTGSLDELAQLADKIMEMAISSSPTIAAVSSTTSKLEYLCKEVTELKTLLENLRNQELDNLSVLSDSCNSSSVGITAGTVILHRNVSLQARKWETPRPLAEGNRHIWPFSQSPISYY